MMMLVMLCNKSSGAFVTKECWRTPNGFPYGGGVLRGFLFAFGCVSVRWINVGVVALLRILLDVHCKDGICVADDTGDRNGYTLLLLFLLLLLLLLYRTDHQPSAVRCLLSIRLREGGCWHRVRTTMDLLRGMLILRGVGFVRRGSIAGLIRVAHLQRVDDGRRMGRIVRIGRADVLLLRER